MNVIFIKFNRTNRGTDSHKYVLRGQAFQFKVTGHWVVCIIKTLLIRYFQLLLDLLHNSNTYYGWVVVVDLPTICSLQTYVEKLGYENKLWSLVFVSTCTKLIHFITIYTVFESGLSVDYSIQIKFLWLKIHFKFVDRDLYSCISVPKETISLRCS